MDSEIKQVQQAVGNNPDLSAILQVLEQIDQKLGKVDELEDDLQEIKNLVKGGDQPSSKLIVKKNGGPGCPTIGKVMKQVKNGGKYDGLSVSQVENILEENGHDRSRKSVLNLMRKISDEFENFKFRKGNSTRASELHFRG